MTTSSRFQLYTQTPCTSVRGPTRTNAFYALETPRGTVYAKHVVHATNAHVGALVPGLAGVVARVRETMSAQRAGTVLRERLSKNGGGMQSYVFYDDPARKGFDYLVQSPHEEQELMFGAGLEGGGRVEGCDGSGRYDVHSASHVSGALSVYFGEHWGAEGMPAGGSGGSRWAAGRVKALWSGELSESADGLPWVGRIPAEISGRRGLGGTGEWVAAGYSGEGMAHAWLCARAVALMVLGMEDRRDLEAETGFGRGERVRDWLPACYLASGERVGRGRQAYVGGRRRTGKARVYP